MSMSYGLFDSNSSNSILFTSWRKRNQVATAEHYRPYADILLDTILWPAMLDKKDVIFSDLKAKCETASSPQELQVPIWEFNFIQDLPKSYRSQTVPFDEQEDILNQAIFDNVWHHTLGVNAFPSPDRIFTHIWDPLPPVGIDKIVSKTDLLTQLAIRFGKNYRVVMYIETVLESDPRKKSEIYSRFKGMLYLQYFPYGLPEKFAALQKACIESQVTNSIFRRVLKDNEEIEFYAA